MSHDYTHTHTPTYFYVNGTKNDTENDFMSMYFVNCCEQYYSTNEN